MSENNQSAEWEACSAPKMKFTQMAHIFLSLINCNNDHILFHSMPLFPVLLINIYNYLPLFTNVMFILCHQFITH